MAEIRLVGKKLKEAEDGKPTVFEPEANFKYNFADKKLDFYGGIQGKIIGEIEISFGIKLKAKIKDYSTEPSKDLAGLSAGIEGSSSVSLTCPFKLNSNGNIDVYFYFSGVILKVWFQASISLPDDSAEISGNPDIETKLIGSFDKIIEIKF